MTLRDAWFAAAGTHEAGDDLIARWSEPHRRYHTVDHLRFMLDVIDAAAPAGDDRAAVRLAAWFHDAVYDPRAADNEERSADLAAAVLAGLGTDPALGAEVVRLVRLTTTHAVEPGDANGALLVDADLAILATDPARYAEYTRAVRAEYRHVPDEAFRAGRAAVLRGLLALPTLFHLPAHREWEAAARANLAAELAVLGAA